jgi:uncharacterized membrane protein YhaH (DUF805 family)
MNISLVSLLFSVQGRINRAKYWIAMIAYLSLTIAVAGLGFFFNFNTLFLVIAGVIALAMIVSGCIVGIKRLHDRNKSGWWLLLFYLLSGVLDVVGMTGKLPLLFELGSVAISAWALVELGFLRGTAGANQYGSDPLAA